MADGIVRHLFIKPKRQNSLFAPSEVYLCQGYGIKGDVNGNRTSPRQILITNQQDLDEFSITPGQLRENIVLNRIVAKAFKPGAKLTFSSGAQIRLTFYCEPCKRIAYLVNSLKSIEQKRGILGVAIKDGKITTGDRVLLEPDYFPALSAIPYNRFLNLIGKIPQGKVITYRQILTSIGVDKSYYRVLPTYIKKAASNYPVHRILDSQGQTIIHIPQHRAKLAAEGINMAINSSLKGDRDRCYSVSLKEYAWQNPSIC